jgi:hypothetical protein
MKFEGGWSIASEATGAHAISMKHLKVMTCFITRTKALSRSHMCLTCKTWRHQEMGDYYGDFKAGRVDN